MKKHALIITAYQDVDSLIELCKLYAPYYLCYVHIDKKTKIVSTDLQELKEIPGVQVIQKYRINWGSYKHVLAICDLLKMAVNDSVDYVHVMSANTFLVWHPKKINSFFEEHAEDIYMEIKEEKNGAFSEFAYRYSAFFFQHIYNLRGKGGFLVARLEAASAMFQQKLKLRRGGGCISPIKGMYIVICRSEQSRLCWSMFVLILNICVILSIPLLEKNFFFKILL